MGWLPKCCKIAKDQLASASDQSSGKESQQNDRKRCSRKPGVQASGPAFNRTSSRQKQSSDGPENATMQAVPRAAVAPDGATGMYFTGSSPLLAANVHSGHGDPSPMKPPNYPTDSTLKSDLRSASGTASFAAAVTSPKSAPRKVGADSSGGRSWPPCHNGCGLTAFTGHQTCCSACSGPEGPHAQDCFVKNRPAQPSCQLGCGRPAFDNFATCCTRCTGSAGFHAPDCQLKADALQFGPVHSGRSLGSDSTDVEENLRSSLAAFSATGESETTEEVAGRVEKLARQTSKGEMEVRLRWMNVVKSARPIGGPTDVYVDLAKRKYGLHVEVLDLGQFSASWSSSCLFLVCAASLLHLECAGTVIEPLTVFCPGEALEGFRPSDMNFTMAADDIIRDGLENREGVLGQMADVLRSAVCDALEREDEFYQPYFVPVVERSRAWKPTNQSTSEDYRRWVQCMRGNAEGDELVVLALCRLCGVAAQTVHKSGYSVPLMDPLNVAGLGRICYWGNDDKHWVWLRPRTPM